jgi:hypothetical protein
LDRLRSAFPPGLDEAIAEASSPAIEGQALADATRGVPINRDLRPHSEYYLERLWLLGATGGGTGGGTGDRTGGGEAPGSGDRTSGGTGVGTGDRTGGGTGGGTGDRTGGGEAPGSGGRRGSWR